MLKIAGQNQSKPMQSIIHNNKILYNLTLLNNEACNSDIRLDGLLTRYVKNENYYILSKAHLKNVYQINMNTSLVTFGDAELCFDILSNKKCKFRDTIIRNVVNMFHGNSASSMPIVGGTNEEYMEIDEDTIDCEKPAIHVQTCPVESPVRVDYDDELEMSAYGVGCSLCNKSTTLKRIRKTGPKKKNVNQLKRNSEGGLGRYQRTEGVKQYLLVLKFIQFIGQDLNSLLNIRYSTKKGKSELLHLIKEQIEIRKGFRAQLAKLLSRIKVDKGYCLWIKDRLLISDYQYHRFRLLTDLRDYLCNKNSIQSERTFWNQIVEQYFGLTITENNGYRSSLRKTIDTIFDIYAIEKGRNAVPHKWEFKMCVDGRQLAEGQTALAIVPLDREDVFPSQGIHSVFYVAIYDGPETKEALKTNFGYIKEEVKELQQLGMETKYGHMEIEFWYVSDLKNCWEVTNSKSGGKFCLFCELQFNMLHDYLHPLTKNARTGLDNLFGIQRHMFCILHLKQRISETLLFLLAQQSQKTKDELEANIKRLPGLTRFHFKLEHNKHGRFFESNHPCMLKGVECNSIFANIKSVLKNTGSGTEVETIWTTWSHIIADMEIKSEEMYQSKPRPHEIQSIAYSKQTRMQWIRMRIETFLKLLGKKYSDCISRSHYLHILGCHLATHLERYDCLMKFSNQGFENSHQLHRRAWKRVTNGGGGRKIVSPIKQLMLWQF